MASTKTAAERKSPTLVVCDDDRMIRQIVRSVAERCGYEVLAGVESAVEALQLAARYNPDVLLLDLVLPNLSGEDVVGPVRAAAPDCSIVIYSSHDAAVAVRNGALFVVPKGATHELEATLNMLKSMATRTAR